MRSYSQVSPTFWTRGSGKALRGNPKAQVLALYFLTAPAANMIGLYYLSMAAICNETGLTESEVSENLELIKDIVTYDTKNDMVWIPEFAAYQLGDHIHGNDKRRVAILRDLSLAGSHPFVALFHRKYGESYSLPKDKLQLELYSETKLKGHPGDEMPPVLLCSVLDPVLDSDQTREPETIEPVLTEAETVKKIFDFWREKHGYKRAVLDHARKTKINARLKDFAPKDLCRAILGALKDDWLMGRDPRAGKKYNEIKTIFRDAAQIERLIELSGQKRGTTGELYAQDPEQALAKKAETDAILARKKEKDLEYNRKMAETKASIATNREDLLKLVK